MKVLVVIVSYNFVPWLDKCLKREWPSENGVDIVVIDNGSTDDTVKLLKTNFPQVKVIENGKNLGFGAANNTGMEIALKEGYDGVVLLNQDAWIDKGCIKALHDAAQAHRDYAIVSPVHLDGSRLSLDKGFAVYTGISTIDELPGEDIVEVPFINAAIWYISTQTLRKTGLFSPIFFFYGEDKDYANRVKFHRMKTGYVPQVFGCHDRAHRATTHEHELRDARIYWLTEYCNLNYSLPRAFALSVLAGIKKCAQSLMKGKVKDGMSYMGISWWLLRKTPQALSTRKNNRKIDLLP